MFDIGWGELVVIGVVALIAIGPKELPGVLRTVGQAMTKLRRMAAEFQGQFQEAMREAEMADLKKEVDNIKDTAAGFTNFNAMEEAKKEVEKSFEDKSASTVGTEPVPDVKIDLPLPEPLPPVTSQDFAPPAPPEGVVAEPAAKKAGSAS